MVRTNPCQGQTVNSHRKLPPSVTENGNWSQRTVEGTWANMRHRTKYFTWA